MSVKEPETIIEYNKEAHYEIVRQWWGLYYEGEEFPSECLPNMGAVALLKGVPAAVAFIYSSPDVKMAHIHFPMVDPELGAGRRIESLKAAISGAIEMAKKFLDGQGFIWCCTDHAVVARVYGQSGMTCAGEADVFYMPVGKQNCDFLK